MFEVHISNTPIFDELCKDFAAIGIHFERLIAGGPIDLRPARGPQPKLVIVDEIQEVEQTDDAADAATPQRFRLDPEVMHPNFWKFNDEE